MFTIPERERLLVYGPQMINVESDTVTFDEYDLLPSLREYLLDIMEHHNGCGLAAPQTGIFKNFLVMQTLEGKFLDMVNPVMMQMWGHEIDGFEACLSLPPVGNGCPVARLQYVKVEYGTSASPNSRETHEFSGLNAIIVQHEMDHLTGTFFIDRAKINRRKEVFELFQKWKRQQPVVSIR